MEGYAKKTFLALLNPFGTVVHTYPGIIDKVKPSVEKFGYAYYMGSKQTSMIPNSLINRMEEKGFLRHTVDRMSYGGRAVDMQLRNPLTGYPMTGSSSGTALNVFYRINDLGIGSDGGGSVLAPAAALNLYGFISPMIEQEYLRQYEKVSTDNITFSPSLGLIGRNLDVIIKAATCALDMDFSGAAADQMKIAMVPEKLDIYDKRETLIPFVKETVQRGTLLMSREGPVDLYGLGDTIFGHFSENTWEIQKKSGKGLMRVANMCGVSALVIPEEGLGCCTLLLCDSNPQDIINMLKTAENYVKPQSTLIERYFGNYQMYFEG